MWVPGSTGVSSGWVVCRGLSARSFVGLFAVLSVCVMVGCLPCLGSISQPPVAGSLSARLSLVVLVVPSVEVAILFLVVLVVERAAVLGCCCYFRLSSWFSILELQLSVQV